MRAILVYVLAAAAVVTAALFGFPEWFGAEAGPSDDGPAPARAAPPVIVAPVVRAPLADSLEALGTVQANESVEITANRADHIATIHFTDGQSVEQGDLLLEMHAEEEKALLAEASAIRDERLSAYQRAKDLFEGSMTSQRDLDLAQAVLGAAEARVIGLQAAINDREVRAPFAGTLGLRRVSVGAYLQPATVITTLDDLSVVKLEFTIPETWLASIESGMSLTATSDAWPGDSFAGRVTVVDTRLDRRTRSVRILALLPNPDTKLRPGMLLKVAVERGETDVLQVPEEALIPVGDEHFVLRIDEDSVAHRVPVIIGRRHFGVVEVVEGLVEGDRVVREGILRVRPESPVVVVDSRGPKV